MPIYISKVRVKWLGLCSVQQQNKGQWAHTGTQGVPYKPEEKKKQIEDNRALAARRGGGVSSSGDWQYLLGRLPVHPPVGSLHWMMSRGPLQPLQFLAVFLKRWVFLSRLTALSREWIEAIRGSLTSAHRVLVGLCMPPAGEAVMWQQCPVPPRSFHAGFHTVGTT